MEPARSEVTIDDERIRVTTWTFGADGASTGAHRHEFDYVVVPVTGGVFAVTDSGGAVRTMTQTAGSPYAGHGRDQSRCGECFRYGGGFRRGGTQAVEAIPIPAGTPFQGGRDV